MIFHLAAAVGVRLVVENPGAYHRDERARDLVLRRASEGQQAGARGLDIGGLRQERGVPFREDADLVLGPPNKTRWGYATSKLPDEFLALVYGKEQGTRDCRPACSTRSDLRQSAQVRDGSSKLCSPGAQWTSRSSFTATARRPGASPGRRRRVGDDGARETSRKALRHVFNIGNGAEISIRDLALKVKAATRSRSPLEFTPIRRCSTKPSRTCLDVCRTSASFGSVWVTSRPSTSTRSSST